MKCFPLVTVTTLQLACFLIAGCVTNRAADLAAIAEYNRQYLQSINDGDIATLQRLTSANHVKSAPGRPAVRGKAANDAANAQSFERNRFDERWYPLETVVSGDWASEHGTYSYTATPKAGGPTRSASGSYLRIYHRQRDGAWKMTYDMFNYDQPPN